ncbi:MAG: hypothetical protein ACE5HU_08505 [Acidobacteriota bacterium]
MMSRTIIGLTAAVALALAGCAQSPDNAAENEVTPAVQEESAPTQAQAPAPAPARAPARTPTPTAAPSPKAAPSHTHAEPRRTASLPKRPSMTTLPEGTILEVQLNSRLSSGANRVGDTFMAEVIEDVRGRSGRVIPAGSTIYGTVSEVKKAKRGAGRASLGITFTQIDLPGGFSSPISASLYEESESKKKKNAAIIGGGAAGGAVLGRILGKNTKGAVIGSIVGGAIGTGVVLSKKGEQVELPAGTVLSIRLDEPLKVPSPA